MAKARAKLRGGLDPTKRGERVPRASASRSHEEILAEQLSAAIASCCSGRWADDVSAGNQEWPVDGMILGRAKVLTPARVVGPNDTTLEPLATDQANNQGQIGSRRWTPPGSVSLEDMLDEMSIKRATYYDHPHAIRYDGFSCKRQGGVEPLKYRDETLLINPDDYTYTMRFDIYEPDNRVLRSVQVCDWPIWRNVRIRRGRDVITYVMAERVPESVEVVEYTRNPHY